VDLTIKTDLLSRFFFVDTKGGYIKGVLLFWFLNIFVNVLFINYVFNDLLLHPEAENLCLQLTEKMSANTEKRLLLAHTPITLVCLEVCAF